MVGDYSGVNWMSADPHAPHPNSIELLVAIAAPTTVVTAELDVPCFHEMSDVLANRIAGARKVTVLGARTGASKSLFQSPARGGPLGMWG